MDCYDMDYIALVLAIATPSEIRFYPINCKYIYLIMITKKECDFLI